MRGRCDRLPPAATGVGPDAPELSAAFLTLPDLGSLGTACTAVSHNAKSQVFLLLVTGCQAAAGGWRLGEVWPHGRNGQEQYRGCGPERRHESQKNI